MIEVLICLIMTSGTVAIVDRVCRKKERVAKLKLDARVLGLPDDNEQRKNEQRKLAEPKLKGGAGEWQGEP